MTTFAFGGRSSALAWLGSPPAGLQGQAVVQSARSALDGLKAGRTARAGYVFSDLRALSIESDPTLAETGLFELAERFLLALPASVPSPELAIDDDDELVFDWRGAHGAMLTVCLGADGRLAYACRMSAFDKEHGVKRFDEEIPKRVVELVQQVSIA